MSDDRPNPIPIAIGAGVLIGGDFRFSEIEVRRAERVAEAGFGQRLVRQTLVHDR